MYNNCQTLIHWGTCNYITEHDFHMLSAAVALVSSQLHTLYPIVERL